MEIPGEGEAVRFERGSDPTYEAWKFGDYVGEILGITEFRSYLWGMEIEDCRGFLKASACSDPTYEAWK